MKLANPKTALPCLRRARSQPLILLLARTPLAFPNPLIKVALRY